MSNYFHIVVCAGIVPDPLQVLEPVTTPAGAALKNEMLLPHVLDPWASHSLYEAANLAKKYSGSKVWLVSMSPKAKLQQVMMTIAQKVPFELVAVDASSTGFSDSHEVSKILYDAILSIQNLEKSRLLLFGGWESASRGAGTTLSILGEMLSITDQFQGVDELSVMADGKLAVLERIEGGKHQLSSLSNPPAVFGWATGNLHEPTNNPQVGMANMRTVMPAIQKAKAVKLTNENYNMSAPELPQQKRNTKIIKEMSASEIAKELNDWING